MTVIHASMRSQLWLPRGGLGSFGVRTFGSEASGGTSSRESDTLEFSYRAKQRLSSLLGGALGLGQLRLKFKSESDALDLSSRKKQLLYSGKDISGDESEVSWYTTIKDSGADSRLKSIDQSIAKAGEILTRMKEIAESAQSGNLTGEERVAMQTEMGRLQHELDTEAGSRPDSRYEDTEAYKMLERAAKRLADGEKWDVAEIAVPSLEYNGGVESWEYHWYVTDDANAPTVGDILKGKGRSVMDSETAEVSAAELEDEIAKLLKQREKLAAFVEQHGAAGPQGSAEASINFSMTVNVLFNGTQRLLASFGRNPVYGEAAHITPFSGEQTPQVPDGSLRKYDINPRPKPYEYKDLWGAVVLSGEDNGWLLSVSVDVRTAGTEPATKTVLRPDPNDPVIPGVSSTRVVATTITKDDPEFYRETPRVNAIYDNNGRLLVKYVDVQVTLPNPSIGSSGLGISIFA